MSNYLGFQPTTSSTYYFVSYNNEDADRISKLVCGIKDAGVPLWYDYGLEYGEEWARQINEKIANAQAVILFFTKGILRKDKSYVKKEYKIAKTLEKKIFVLFIDEVSKKDVSIENVDWWVDIVEGQGINAYKSNSIKEIVQETKRALGIDKEENSRLRSAAYACPYCGKMVEKDKVLFVERSATLSSDLKYGTFLRWHGMKTPPGYKYPRVFYRVRPGKNVVEEDENGFPMCIKDSREKSIYPMDLERELKNVAMEDENGFPMRIEDSRENSMFPTDFDKIMTEVGICDDTTDTKENQVHMISDRACPYCHCQLPYYFGSINTHHVMMFGNKNAGKTFYVFNLFQQLKGQLLNNHLGSVSIDEESDKYLEMLAESQNKIGQTMPEVVYRGMLPIVCRYTKGYETEDAMIVFDDISSEGTADLVSMAENRGIVCCETIMLLIDPSLLLGQNTHGERGGKHSADQYYSHIEVPDEFDSLDELISQVSMISEATSPMIRNVICVITKLDKIIQKEGKTFLSECPNTSNDIGDNHLNGVDLQTLERVDQELCAYFKKYADIDLREKLTSVFGTDVKIWILGVSIATRTDNGADEARFEMENSAEFSKHRIIEPFLAILLGLGLAEEKNEVGSSGKELSEAKEDKEEAKKHGFWTLLRHKG